MTGVTSDGRIRHSPLKVGALRGQRVSPGPLQVSKSLPVRKGRGSIENEGETSYIGKLTLLHKLDARFITCQRSLMCLNALLSYLLSVEQTESPPMAFHGGS